MLQRYRRALGFCSRKQHIKVKSTRAQLEKRRLFSIEHQNTNILKWISIEETQIRLRNSGTIVWVKRDEPTPIHEISPLRVSVDWWGAIW
ncbi:unnamed protein product [Rotaria sp. Silwood2]|nr:unnamed protein product [Rotaria sp. Silwood2]CAF3084791.1 unnamed protein product [Rotaria sp. Silwood2]CAF3324835.1 unnamed protein product [Rotaria sp. Silwood2]CAF4379354.1 unnamed protein product [Rotaria sp. Silwood2]CAF4435080.1 unnamed protein product [Rotaria sp. Silwood2]